MALNCGVWAKRVAAVLVLGVCRAQGPASPEKAISALGADSNGIPTFGTTVVIPSGLRGQIYRLSRDTLVLPDFKNLEPVGTIWTSTLNISPRHWKAGFPGVTKQNEWFAIDYTGRFWIEKPGEYRFALKSDDGSKLYIDDEEVIDNDCQHPPAVVDGAVTLSGGPHRIRVSYFQGPRDCIALTLAVAGPDEDWRIFSTDEFKPPRDTEDWKYGDPSELKVPVDPDANRKKLGRSSLKPPKNAPAADSVRMPRGSFGCDVSGAPRCHE